MRRLFIRANGDGTLSEAQLGFARSELNCSDGDALREAVPWAAEIIKAEGGWWAFESAADAETWHNQQ